MEELEYIVSQQIPFKDTFKLQSLQQQLVREQFNNQAAHKKDMESIDAQIHGLQEKINALQTEQAQKRQEFGNKEARSQGFLQSLNLQLQSVDQVKFWEKDWEDPVSLV